MAEGFAVQIISNSTLSVDTFFFLSGFLVSYLYLNGKKVDKKNHSTTDNNMNKKKKINYKEKFNEFFLTILRRFIR